MKLLLVGGNGYYAGMIASHLARDFDITIFDRQGDTPPFPCVFIRGDIMDKQAMRKASIAQDSMICFFMGDAELSTVGISNVFATALESGIRHVIYTSSGGMTYPIPFLSGSGIIDAAGIDEVFWESYFPIVEDHGLFPGLETERYFLFKWICEQLGIYFTRRGLKFTAIRPGNFMKNDMTCREAEKAKVVDPTHLLINGHVTVRDSAYLYKSAVLNPPQSYAIYNLSNDTSYSVLSTEKARNSLGYRCAEPQVYYDFYRKQDWRETYRVLADKGIPKNVLMRLHAFQQR